MKIAICFSGQIRTGVLTIENIKAFIGHLFPFCDFFIHTWDLTFQNPLTGETWDHYHEIHKTIPYVSLSDTNIHKLNNEYTFKSALIEEYGKTLDINKIKYSINTAHDNNNWWNPWFYSWYKSIELKKMYELNNNMQYDFVVKLRPDIIFSKEIKLNNLLNYVKENTFCVNQVYTDHSGSIVDDILFISDSPTSNTASSWWEYNITSGEYLINERPHVKLHNYIVKKDIVPVDMTLPYLGEKYSIGLYRPECKMFNPITEFEKCVECDRLHYHTEQVAPNISEEELLELAKSTKEKRDFLPNKLKKYENSDLL